MYKGKKLKGNYNLFSFYNYYPFDNSVNIKYKFLFY